jgi:hypothetical protein
VTFGEAISTTDIFGRHEKEMPVNFAKQREEIGTRPPAFARLSRVFLL